QMVVMQALTKDSTCLIGNQVKCKVKWFNLQKGYGFLEPCDSSADVFLHFSVLEQAGFQTVSPGDEVLCEVGNGKSGLQAVRVLQVCSSDEEGNYAEIPATLSNDSLLLEEHGGFVKWFNVLKGYGFIQADDGGRDIFLHTALLRRLSVDRLPPGRRVRVKVLASERGREAREIFLEDEEAP
ncbi:MAG: cold shock domain-containing protein, partial [Alphaproteobacteria bacterium]